MKTWLKGGLIGAGIGFVISLILLIVFLITVSIEGPTEGAGLAFPGLLLNLIIFPIIGFLVLGIAGFLLTKLKDPNLTLTKKGIWAGICVAVLIGFFGVREAYRSAGLGHKKEYLIYTLIFSIIFLIGLILVGWILQNIKNKSNWQNWGHTKKGIIIGLVAGILAFILWIVYAGYWMYTANKGLSDLINDGGFWIIPASLVVPIIICTIIGWIIGKIKPKEEEIK